MTLRPSAIIAAELHERRAACALVSAPGFDKLDGLIDDPRAPDETAVAALVGGCLDEAERRGIVVRGLALATPSGRYWRDLGATIAERFRLPVVSERVAKASLRGEIVAGAAKGCGSGLLFDTDHLDIGLLLNGGVYSGAAGAAGCVAHLGVDRTGDVRCRCGKTGCLVALIGLGAEAPAPRLPSSLPPMPSHRHGWLAIAGIHLLNVLNPAIMILRGSAISDDAEFAWLRQALRCGCLGPTRVGLLDIVRATPGDALLGAAAHFALGHP